MYMFIFFFSFFFVVIKILLLRPRIRLLVLCQICVYVKRDERVLFVVRILRMKVYIFFFFCNDVIIFRSVTTLVVFNFECGAI